MTRFGTVTISGLPNAGKSTLLNRLLGARLSPVTHKVQTTRFTIRGVLTRGKTQMMLLDAPGMLQKRGTPLEKTMARAVRTALSEADVALHLVDVNRAMRIPVHHWGIPRHNHLLVALNKVDTIKRPALLKLIADLDAHLATRDNPTLAQVTPDPATPVPTELVPMTPTEDDHAQLSVGENGVTGNEENDQGTGNNNGVDDNSDIDGNSGVDDNSTNDGNSTNDDNDGNSTNDGNSGVDDNSTDDGNSTNDDNDGTED
nr:50S ribosome-binding GTPase [Alphaproteobacteria bacterium]